MTATGLLSIAYHTVLMRPWHRQIGQKDCEVHTEVAISSLLAVFGLSCFDTIIPFSLTVFICYFLRSYRKDVIYAADDGKGTWTIRH